MKIEVNITKKYVFLIVGIFLILAGVFAVYAYKSGQSPSILGHSAEEIEITLANGTVVSLQQAISGSMIKVAVAGGVCMNGISNYWSLQQGTWGGASCSGNAIMNDGGVLTLNCPANAPSKIVLNKVVNSGIGGEGALCF